MGLPIIIPPLLLMNGQTIKYSLTITNVSQLMDRGLFYVGAWQLFPSYNKFCQLILIFVQYMAQVVSNEMKTVHTYGLIEMM